MYGTVCQLGFDRNDAGVVCAQLGYSRISELESRSKQSRYLPIQATVLPLNSTTLQWLILIIGASPLPNEVFGPGTDDSDVYLTNLLCAGNESTLLDCVSTPVSEGDICSHFLDVGVLCDPEQCEFSAIPELKTMRMENPCKATTKMEAIDKSFLSLLYNLYTCAPLQLTKHLKAKPFHWGPWGFFKLLFVSLPPQLSPKPWLPMLFPTPLSMWAGPSQPSSTPGLTNMRKLVTKL